MTVPVVMTPLLALQVVLPDSKPLLPRSWAAVQVPVPPPPPPPLLLPPPASQAVAFRARAALVAPESFQPSYSVLPDWPVPSSIGELSPQKARRPLPKVLRRNSQVDCQLAPSDDGNAHERR